MPPYDFPPIQRLAVPAVCFLISFLGYTSQYLFYHISPGHLSNRETLWFNGLILCIWWCYYNTVTIDPGPQGWVREFDTVAQGKKNEDAKDNEGVHDESDEAKLRKGLRWCKKCEAVKPPRAHHCRACGRCIPKMDHHCPWTQNCVSHTTFPHFLRFVFYCVISLSLLEYHLFIRLSDLWSSRNLPAYLGPPVWAMAHLLVLTVLNSTALFALSILLVRATYSLAINTTMIESWEIERHEALVQRSKKNGGWTYASGGQKIHIRCQEFPYDIGIWTNVVQGMGTSNILSWILPFGGGPSIQSAGNWEVNGFEEEHVLWPPIDPDKMPRTAIKEAARIYEDEQDEIAAFKKRQEKDYQRWNGKVEEDDGFEELEEYESDEYEYEEGIDGEEGWTNSDGDRLRDFGVDEEAEVLADDDIPLGELLRRRKARNYNLS